MRFRYGYPPTQPVHGAGTLTSCWSGTTTTSVTVRRFGRGTAIIGWVLPILAALASLSCQPQATYTGSPQRAGIPRGTISVQEMAARLNMHVVTDSPAYTALRDSNQNTVSIFADPFGRAIVNGTPTGGTGGFVRIGSTLYIPNSVETAIRTRLGQDNYRYTPRTRDGSNSLVGKTIMIDAGHGGKDPGAIAATGLREKDVNLDVTKRLASLLRSKGATVLLTRDTDDFIALDDRAELANRARPDLFISIHADAAETADARGFTAYISRNASNASFKAADAIVSQMQSTGLENRGVRKANFVVVHKTACPAVLVELGFLSNRDEAQLLADEGFRQQLALSLADGVSRHLGG